MSPIVTGLLLFCGVSFFVMTMQGRFAPLLVMKRENRLDDIPARIKALIMFGLGQKRMVDPEEFLPGLMHVAIFAAFMVLALRTLMLFVMGFSETALEVLSTPTEPFWLGHPAIATLFNLYLVVKDLVAAAAVLGSGYFWYLRWRVKPDRMTPSWEAYLILGFIIGLMVTEFTFGASHMIAQGRGFTVWEPV